MALSAAGWQHLPKKTCSGGMDYRDVIHFWFSELKPSPWWVKDAALDQAMRQRFLPVHDKASRCELYAWRSHAEGRLAEVIVLDQFSRNLFRDSAKAFACDAQALALAQEAIAAGVDASLDAVQRSFLYMPFMHSESLVIHEKAMALFEQNGIASNLEYEIKHKAIIERFGRYPHRNALLGRESTAEELAFLKEPGSRF